MHFDVITKMTYLASDSLGLLGAAGHNGQSANTLTIQTKILSIPLAIMQFFTLNVAYLGVGLTQQDAVTLLHKTAEGVAIIVRISTGKTLNIPYV